MNSSRRNFLQKTGLLAGGLSLLPFTGFPEEILPEELPFSPAMNDDDFWRWVRESYTTTSNLINLNNGGVSPQPKQVQEVFEHYNRMSNEGPSYYMWRILDKGRESVRRELAELAGVTAEEIAIQRNSTESLATIIFGLTLVKGDEIIVTNYDYPNMRHDWLQREQRDGIKLIWIDIPIGLDDTEKIVKLYTDAITPKTKIIHITHMINWTGHLLPAKEITTAAHKKGIEVVLDAAHSFAHVGMNLKDINCDYAGSSLHKWLCCPFGTGILYVRKDKIANLWPLFPIDKPQSEDIKKFEALGTRSFPAEMAIGKAISFHKTIGMERKETRLRWLKNYWVNKVKGLPKIKFYSPISDHASCAIATVGIEGIKASEIENHLFSKYNVHTVAIEWEKVSGIRVTPSVYTSTEDLDKLVAGLRELAG